MDKVYLVMGYIDYEGEEVLYITLDENKADLFMKEGIDESDGLRNKYTGITYDQVFISTRYLDDKLAVIS